MRGNTEIGLIWLNAISNIILSEAWESPSSWQDQLLLKLISDVPLLHQLRHLCIKSMKCWPGCGTCYTSLATSAIYPVTLEWGEPDTIILLVHQEKLHGFSFIELVHDVFLLHQLRHLCIKSIAEVLVICTCPKPSLKPSRCGLYTILALQ